MIRTARGGKRGVFVAAPAASMLLPALGLLAAGCSGPRHITWSERTAALNKVYHAGGRADRQIVYRDSQTPGAPLTLLLIHGLGSSKATWQYVAPALERKHRVIMVDLLGHGDSSKPRDADYSPSAQAAILLKFITDNDLRNLVMVGVSYGGAAALETALPFFQAGQGSRIRGLVLLDAAALYFPPPPLLGLLECPVTRDLALLLNSPESLSRTLLEKMYSHPVPQEMVDEYARIVRQPEAIHATAAAARGLFAELQARRGAACRYAVIDCPVLLVWGQCDTAVPRAVMCELAAVLPRSRADLVMACGHAVEEDCPAPTLAAIESFLAELDLASEAKAAPKEGAAVMAARGE